MTCPNRQCHQRCRCYIPAIVTKPKPNDAERLNLCRSDIVTNAAGLR